MKKYKILFKLPDGTASDKHINADFYEINNGFVRFYRGVPSEEFESVNSLIVTAVMCVNDQNSTTQQSTT
jgi:hypothetical protein